MNANPIFQLRTGAAPLLIARGTSDFSKLMTQPQRFLLIQRVRRLLVENQVIPQTTQARVLASAAEADKPWRQAATDWV